MFVRQAFSRRRDLVDMTDAHHLTDIESIRTELRALSKHITRSASKALLEEVDVMLSVTESYVDAAVLTVRRIALESPDELLSGSAGGISRSKKSRSTSAASSLSGRSENNRCIYDYDTQPWW